MRCGEVNSAKDDGFGCHRRKEIHRENRGLGEREVPKDKSNKHDPKPSGWTGNYLIAGNLDGLLVLRDQTPLMKLAQVALARLRPSPATIGDASGGGALLAAGSSAGAHCGGGLLRFPHCCKTMVAA